MQRFMQRSRASLATLSFPACAFITATFLTGTFLAAGCSTGASAQRPTMVRGSDAPAPSGGIAPDKESEIQLVLQQRQSSIHRCYQTELNERQDRNFQGNVKVLLSMGTDGRARDVRVVGGTLPQSEVQPCLVAAIKEFEFPTLENPGDTQAEFQFKPAY